jgi:phosphoribosylanthranilate isomerase
MPTFFEVNPTVVRTKICGVTCWEDAAAAIDAGADAIGINLVAGSRRCIELKAAIGWIEKVSREVTTVAVTMNPSWEHAEMLLSAPYFAALQLHGMETPEFCARLADLRKPVIKAISYQAGFEKARAYPVAAILVDSSAEGEFGGTGRSFPWRGIDSGIFPGTLIVSGGLTPENVGEAIRVLRPHAVDVASGVELSPGRKDPVKLKRFISAVHGAERSRDDR